jgi:hypothetical protein
MDWLPVFFGAVAMTMATTGAMDRTALASIASPSADFASWP